MWPDLVPGSCGVLRRYEILDACIACIWPFELICADLEETAVSCRI